MNQPTDYEFPTANTSDAEIVRRFLAKAYGGEHPAMRAMGRLERHINCMRGDFGSMVAFYNVRNNHQADASHLPRKTTGAIKVWLDTDAIAGWLDKDGALHIVDQGGRSLDDGERRATLHGDFGEMEFTKKQDYASLSHWGLVCSD